jgi:hypothetical protein
MIDKKRVGAIDVANAFEVTYTDDNKPVFEALKSFFMFGDANLRNEIDFREVLAVAWKIYEAAMSFHIVSEATKDKIEAFHEYVGISNMEHEALGVESSLFYYESVEEGIDTILSAAHLYFKIDNFGAIFLDFLTPKMSEAHGIVQWSLVDEWITNYVHILEVFWAADDYRNSGKHQWRFGH